MSKKADKADAKAERKEEGQEGQAARRTPSAGPSVASHPRASYQVRRAKGWGGIAGFAVAAYLSYKAGVPTSDLGLRALAAGIAGYMLAWACAVTVWRHLVLAELRATVDPGAAPNPDLIPARAAQPAKPATPPDDVATPAPEGAPAG